MSATHAYRYAGPSALQTQAAEVGCRLVGDREGLFRGRVRAPRTTALALRALVQTVMTRFYTPPGLYVHLLDPVVTVGREQLRFEGFSGCCSTYARLDLGDAAFVAVEERSTGTTNVDFQAPMRSALAKVRDDTPFVLEVGQHAVAVDTGGEQIVERKVPFPTRWLKGLGEVQAYLSRMEPKFTVSRVEALRFLRSVPTNSRHETYVAPVGRGLRLAHRASKDAVRVTGAERLRVLEGLVPFAEELRVHADPFGSSAWALDLGGMTFTLTLSPERWRGFSGEGQLLSALATADVEGVLARVRASLRWQDAVDPRAIAADAEVDEQTVRESLAMLASRGVVGFDLAAGTWFHRELPFDLGLVEALHPRLRDARKLVAAGAVQLSTAGALVKGEVQSGDVTYRVSLGAEGDVCTCPWYAKHAGERGPCKHVLAVQIAAEEA